jgi:hypothetical protein
MIVYEGPSQLDGAPIVVILTLGSRNSKTGAMAQTWIMRSDLEPHAAVGSGHDSSVCGDCPRRPLLARANGETSCYVRTFQAPLSVYRAYRRGIYPRIALGDLAALLSGHRVRIGSYGDPAAAPLEVWRAIAGAAEAHTGYSHQWRQQRFADYAELLMASVDSTVEALEAMALGWRYFRVAPRGDRAKLEREISCPASKESVAKTTCGACRACGGLAARAKVSIVIQAH